MVWCDNGITAYCWPIPNCLYGNKRRWVCDKVSLVILTYDVPAQPIVPIPLPVYTTCIFVQHGPVEIGLTTLSVVYGTKLILFFILETPTPIIPDLLVFSVIAYLVIRSYTNGVPVPSLLRTIAQDTTYYFLVLFTSHVMLVLFLSFASVSISS